MINGLIVKELKENVDPRGSLIELFRTDELPCDYCRPAMAYISNTNPGVERGPHEHRLQTDLFVFLDGEYELYLWENRKGYEEEKLVLKVGKDNPVAVWVPAGVVHAYKNVGNTTAFVLNFPDTLYAGWKKKDKVDEIRHENDPNSKFSTSVA